MRQCSSLLFVVIRKIATISLWPIRRDAISSAAKQASIIRLVWIISIICSLATSVRINRTDRARKKQRIEEETLAPSLLPYVSRHVAINILVATSIRPDAPGFRFAPKQQTMTRTWRDWN